MEYLREHDQGPALSFAWEPLLTSGSTSSRKQVNVATEGAGHPGLSFVMKKYEIPDKPFEESQQQARREYEALRTLWNIERQGWRIPEPVAFLPEYAIVIMAYCNGQTASQYFWSMVKPFVFSRLNLERIRGFIKDIGGVLLELQDAPVEGGVWQTVGPDWYLAFLEEQLAALQSFNVRKSQVDAVRERVASMLPQLLGSEARCFQHTDFYLNNILMDGETIVVLDFPNSCIGTKYWDISHFLVSLDDYRMFRNVDQGVIGICKDEFESIFGLDRALLRSMMLVHTCFSFKLMTMKTRRGLRGALVRDQKKYYGSVLEELLDGH